MKRTNRFRASLAILLTLMVTVGCLVSAEIFMAYASSDTCEVDDCGGTYVNGFCAVCDGYQPAVETTNQHDVDGDQEKDTVYEISNAGQLYWFMEVINGGYGGVEQNQRANAILLENIDLNPGYLFTFMPDSGLVRITKTEDDTVIAYLGTGIVGDNSGDNSVFDETASVAGTVYTDDEGATLADGEADPTAALREWFPIGYSHNGEDVYFGGIFDGKGKTVSGLYFNNSEQDYVGMFGQIDTDATVKNVGVENSYICGSDSVGGVVGWNGGTVTNSDNTGTVSGSNDVGGVVGGNDGTVTNSDNTGTVSGSNDVGGVVGYNYGTVSNSDNTGTVSGSNDVGGVVGINDGPVTNCYNTGNVSGSDYVGGVMGINDGTVTNSYNTGTVSGRDSVGGVAGMNLDTVTNCYYDSTAFSGDAVGLDFGMVDATTVLGMAPADFESGKVAYLLSLGCKVNVSTGEYDEDNAPITELKTFAGDVWGQNLDNGEERQNAPTFTDAKVYTKLGCDNETPVGYSNTDGITGIHVYNANGFCTICDGYQPAVETTDHVYEISNAGQLYWFMEVVNGGYGDVAQNKRANAILLENIDLNPGYQFTFMPDSGLVRITKTEGNTVIAYLGTGIVGDNSGDNSVFDGTASVAGTVYTDDEGATLADGEADPTADLRKWFPIGYSYDRNKDTEPENISFGGIFDGKGKTVSGLYFNNSEQECVGLFGQIDMDATVKNVGVENSYIIGRSNVGGVVGINEGPVTNCYNTANVSGSDYAVGGVVGTNDGTVTNCYNTGNVSGRDIVGGVVSWNYGTVSNSDNTGNISGSSTVGGVVGINGGTVTNSCNTGTVSGSYSVGGVVGSNDGTVTNSDNTGTVSGSGYAVGGVVGYNNKGEVTNSNNAGNISGSGDWVGGVVGDNFNGPVTNCYNTGNVSGSNEVGGVVGTNDGTVTNCYNTGNVSGSDSVGGVAGFNYGTVTNCYYDSTAFSGDAVEDDWGTVDATTVLGMAPEDFESGKVAYLLSLGCVVNVSTGEYDEDNAPITELKTFAGDVWGQNLDNGEERQTAPTFTGAKVYTKLGCDNETPVGYSNTDGITGIHVYNVNGFCTICDGYQPAVETTDKHDVDGDQEKDTVYEISNAGQLYWFMEVVNGGYGDVEQKLNANAILLENIDLNPGYQFTFMPDSGLVRITKTEDDTVIAYLGTGIVGDNSGDNSVFDGTASVAGTVYTDDEGTTLADGEADPTADLREWFPIGYYYNGKDVYFGGIFDGNGKTVSGLYFNNSEQDYVGMFGQIDTDATVKNVGVENSYICGSNFVGGVVGYNDGTVSNSDNTGTVSGSGCYVGGVVGGNDGTVSNSDNTGTVSGSNDVGGVVGGNDGTVTNSDNTGTVSGSNDVGGVVGSNDGTVTNSDNTGTVSGSGYAVGGVVGFNNTGEVTNSDNTGNVSGSGDWIGGVVGMNHGTVTNCYNTGTVSGSYSVGGVVGSNDGTVTNCYNTGTVSGSGEVGGVVGDNNNGTVTNCYYLGTEETDSIEGTSFKTTAQFASGEVAYLLNGDQSMIIWYQTVGEGTPSFSGRQVYSGYDTCLDHAEKVYSNDPNDPNAFPVQKPDHQYDANTGKCSSCGEIMVASITKDGATRYFDTLSGALLNAESGNTVVLLSDVEEESVSVEEGVTLNAGSFTVQVTEGSLVNSGTLIGGTYHLTEEYDVVNQGTIESGTFYADVNNQGTVSGGTFHEALNNFGTIQNNGNVVLGENGVFNNDEDADVNCDDDAHFGGTANCTEKALCTLCGTAYGDPDADNHESDTDDGDCTTEVTCIRCDHVFVDAKASHEASADDGDCTTAVICKNCTTVATAAKASHEASADDGDCTTAVICKNCTTVVTAAKASHEASADDGDCTTAVICKNCTTVVTAAKASHEASADDGDCTTAVICKNCTTVVTAAKASHEASADDGNCTTAVICKNCTTVVTAAKASHEASADDGDCTTAVICKNCTTVATAAKASHEASADDGDCTTAVICKNCTTVVTAAKASHEASADDGDCTTAVICKNCTTVVTAAKDDHTDTDADNKCDACGTEMGTTDSNAPGSDTNEPGTSDTETPPAKEKDGLGAGAIVGIVIGSVAVAGIGGFSIFWFAIKKKNAAELLETVKSGVGKVKSLFRKNEGSTGGDSSDGGHSSENEGDSSDESSLDE